MKFIRENWIWIVMPALLVAIAAAVMYASLEGGSAGSVYPM